MPQPIFILGMTGRAGTQFLYELLALHPDTTQREPIWEDYLLRASGHLLAYADQLSRRWATFDVPPQERVRLLRCLGDGLIAFLNEGAAGKRVVTVTPNVRNLQYFFDLFPDATLVLLVRDGRSVVESMMRSFGLSRARATARWAAAARTILAFAGEERRDRYLVVRYEDLVERLEEELAEVLRFCGLSVEDYDFASARSLPLRGSSTDRGGSSEVQWGPMERPADFGGVARYSGWSAADHRAFNRRAGDLLSALGYEPAEVGPPGPLERVGVVAGRAAAALARQGKGRRSSLASGSRSGS
jgi:protein-tyrosine sulfotransferase